MAAPMNEMMQVETRRILRAWNVSEAEAITNLYKKARSIVNTFTLYARDFPSALWARSFHPQKFLTYAFEPTSHISTKPSPSSTSHPSGLLQDADKLRWTDTAREQESLLSF
ncbi:hypothetical protein B0A50_08557 [Salinomyces thailandicus]|uniref:Uncharacterized protein n=1 Tax=Salinomyces thailandicus TaxID=706561 RepID=A0A4U0TJG4_9PEZI|nr:hypothetical protein B0A50_08557 [Salinomyces thailandica]